MISNPIFRTSDASTAIYTAIARTDEFPMHFHLSEEFLLAVEVVRILSTLRWGLVAVFDSVCSRSVCIGRVRGTLVLAK